MSRARGSRARSSSACASPVKGNGWGALVVMPSGYPDLRRGHIAAACAIIVDNIPDSPVVEHPSSSCSHHREPTARPPGPGMRPAARQTGLDPCAACAAGRKDDMLSRSAHTPATLSRRAQAQRRLRRAASHRLFCSTNGCTTFLVPDEEGAARRVPHLRPAAQPRAARSRAERPPHPLSVHHPAMAGVDDSAVTGPFDGSLTARGLTIRLQTRGRSSGQPRLVTIGFVERPDGSLLVAASSPLTHWARNLGPRPALRRRAGGAFPSLYRRAPGWGRRARGHQRPHPPLWDARRAARRRAVVPARARGHRLTGTGPGRPGTLTGRRPTR